MSVISQCQLDQVFSYSHLLVSRKKVTNLQQTSLYIATPCNPTTTHLCHGYKARFTQPNACGIITCHDFTSLEFIRRQLNRSLTDTFSLLLGVFSHPINILFILLDTQHYVARSIRINMSWCRKMWSISSRAHYIAITGVYFSVLGGAYCSLGKSNTKYAYKAGALAIEQIKLAQRLKDPILECKCWLYYAEDLIQISKLKKANKIISRQAKFIESLQDVALTSMLDSVIDKMDVAVSSKQKDHFIKIRQ